VEHSRVSSKASWGESSATLERVGCAGKLIGRTTSLAADRFRESVIAILRKNFCDGVGTREYDCGPPALPKVVALRTNERGADGSHLFRNAFGKRVKRHLACNLACL